MRDSLKSRKVKGKRVPEAKYYKRKGPVAGHHQLNIKRQKALQQGSVW